MAHTVINEGQTPRKILIGWANDQQNWVRAIVTEVFNTRRTVSDEALDEFVADIRWKLLTGLTDLTVAVLESKWFVYSCGYCDLVFVRAGSYQRKHPHQFCSDEHRSAYNVDKKREA